jgi:hypothetical protein
MPKTYAKTYAKHNDALDVLRRITNVVARINNIAPASLAALATYRLCWAPKRYGSCHRIGEDKSHIR